MLLGGLAAAGKQFGAPHGYLDRVPNLCTIPQYPTLTPTQTRHKPKALLSRLNLPRAV
jgi:hypothetical protein